MLGLQPLTQLFQRLIVDRLDARCQHIFQATQFQRNMVALSAGMVVPDLTPPRTCPCHVRLADSKTSRHLNNGTACVEHTVS
jgi:hypothetical protein